MDLQKRNKSRKFKSLLFHFDAISLPLLTKTTYDADNSREARSHNQLFVKPVSVS